MPEQDAQTPPATEDSTAQPTDVGEGHDVPSPSNEQIASRLKTRRDASIRNRKLYHNEWKRNVELRIGHIATLYTGGLDAQDDLQTEINPDWSLTKTKTANLYSQVPTVRLTHENKTYAGAIPPFAKALNYEISTKRANVGVPMEEGLNDMVNAAGVGAVFCGYAARFQDKTVPAIDTKLIPPEILKTLTEVEIDTKQPLDPDAVGQMLLNRQMPVKRVPQVVSDSNFARRVSPVDLLWPVEFTGSNFDDGDYIGYTGRYPWAVAKSELKLTDEDYDKVISNADERNEDSLRSNPERSALMEAKTVKYHEIYYWRHRFDPNEKHFDCIWKIVFVEGRDTAVIHEPWTGQKKITTASGRETYIGNRKFPVRVCTLTYITDNPIPPSDSAAGRPQVNDMRRSRRDMFNNRERSIPIRWFDVNRIDQAIQESLMRGTWQGMIPTNGDGGRSIGEIARASYPSENLQFDQQAQADLMQSWQIGPNQLGTQAMGDETAAAANIGQQNFATRIGQERGRVAAWFLSIVEQIAGNMVLYSDFPSLSDQEKQQMMQAWDQKQILQDLVLKILPDSQIVLDVNQRIQKLVNFLNFAVKSGYVNPKPIIVEIAELSGIDPSEVVVDPQPKEDEPNISYRFSGKDDLMNPIVVAMLMKKSQMPSPDEVEAAKKLLLMVQEPPQSPQPAGPEGQPPSPEGPDGASPPPPGEAPVQAAPMHPTDGAHGDWHTASKVAKRSRDT